MNPLPTIFLTALLGAAAQTASEPADLVPRRVAEAEAAMAAEDWPQAVGRWEDAIRGHLCKGRSVRLRPWRTPTGQARLFWPFEDG